MSKIEITSSNVDKFVKRFHKVSDAKNNGKKLSESQEIFAQSLGCQNYNELKTILENENISVNEKKDLKLVNELYKGWVIENNDTLDTNIFLIELNNVVTSKSKEMSKVELFYNQLLTLLNHPKSKISLCLFEKDGFEYSLKLTTCYGDEISYVFGKFRTSLDNVLLDRGFSLLDTSLLSSILSNSNSNSTKINLSVRFEAIDFANDLYQYLLEKMGKQKIYVLKFNKDDNINNKYIFKNNTLYEHELIFLSYSDYEKIIKSTQSINIEDKEKFEFYVFNNNHIFEYRTNNGECKLDYYRNIGNNQNIIIRKTDINLGKRA